MWAKLGLQNGRSRTKSKAKIIEDSRWVEGSNPFCSTSFFCYFKYLRIMIEPRGSIIVLTLSVALLFQVLETSSPRGLTGL